jgi:hypothetical protein
MSLKSFKLWLEVREGRKKVERLLLKRLGFTKDAVDNSSLKIRSFEKDRLLQAVSQMGLDDDKVSELQNWIRSNPDSTIQNLLSQVSDRDISADNSDDPGLPAMPAKLPQGTPKPQKQAGPPQVQFGSNTDQPPSMMPPMPPMG